MKNAMLSSWNVINIIQTPKLFPKSFFPQVNNLDINIQCSHQDDISTLQAPYHHVYKLDAKRYIPSLIIAVVNQMQDFLPCNLKFLLKSSAPVLADNKKLTIKLLIVVHVYPNDTSPS